MELFALQIVFFVLIKQITAWNTPWLTERGRSFCRFCDLSKPEMVFPPIFCPPTGMCPPPACPMQPPCQSQICSPYGAHNAPITVQCCKGCKCSVRFKRDSSSVNDLMHEINPICNNDQLMKIMEKKIGTNATESAFAIKEEADSKLNAQFGVFCAMNDLIYVTHAGSFCRYKKGDIICFAYKF